MGLGLILLIICVGAGLCLGIAAATMDAGTPGGGAAWRPRVDRDGYMIDKGARYGDGD